MLNKTSTNVYHPLYTIVFALPQFKEYLFIRYLVLCEQCHACHGLGGKLDPVNWDELTYLTPATAVLNDNQPDTVPTVIGRPLYYAKHPTNPYDIRIYPTPNLTLLVPMHKIPIVRYQKLQPLKLVSLLVGAILIVLLMILLLHYFHSI